MTMGVNDQLKIKIISWWMQIYQLLLWESYITQIAIMDLSSLNTIGYDTLRLRLKFQLYYFHH